MALPSKADGLQVIGVQRLKKTTTTPGGTAVGTSARRSQEIAMLGNAAAKSVKNMRDRSLPTMHC
eukprot:2428906-Pyramimonas_sp.AAC.2